ncbi:MAG: hypothetical protein ABFE01_01805 [Phycisphaerales bacterium]
MAINWEVTIRDVKIDEGRADVIATRTDTENPTVTKTYTMENTPLATVQDRAAALAWIKEQVEADAARATQVAAFVANLEQTAKANLETWESERT